MTMAAISLLSVPKPVTADGPATGAVAADGPVGFAAMMAGAGHPGASRGAATQDAKDIKGGKDSNAARDAKGAKVASDTRDADTDRDGLDDVRDADKYQHDDRAKDDSVPSTTALLGLVVPPAVLRDDHGATAGGAQSGEPSSAVGTAIASRPPLGSDAKGDRKADALSGKTSDAADLAPMLAALTDTLAKGVAVHRAGAEEPTTGKEPATGKEPMTGKGGFSIPPQGVDGQKAAPAKGAKAIPLGADATAMTTEDSAQTALSPTGSTAASAGKTDIALPTPSPLPATATLMAARAATTSSDAVNTQTRKPAANAHAGDEREQDADALADVSATPATATPVAAPLIASGDKMAPASSSIIDGAGQQLAAATTDRQLDLARQGAWLDGIAHDISAAGASTGTVRFEVAPQHLGTVSVELRRDDSGAAVTLTAGSEAARSALSDATPQLLAEARAHGLHIANAQVDVGSGKAGSGGNPSPDSQGRSSGGQPDGRHAASQNSGFSAQTGMGSDTGRQSQTRSQPLPDYRSGSARADCGPAGEAKASVEATSVRSPDARYA